MVKEILGYICLAAAAVSFVTMYLLPKIRSRKEGENHRRGASQTYREAQGR